MSRVIRRRRSFATIAALLLVLLVGGREVALAEYGSDSRFVVRSSITDLIWTGGTLRGRVWLERNQTQGRVAAKLDVTHGTLDIARVFLRRAPTNCGSALCAVTTVADFAEHGASMNGRILSTPAVTERGARHQACAVLRDGGSQVTSCSDFY